MPARVRGPSESRMSSYRSTASDSEITSNRDIFFPFLSQYGLDYTGSGSIVNQYLTGMVKNRIRRTGSGTGPIPLLGSGWLPLPWLPVRCQTVQHWYPCGYRQPLESSGPHGSPWFCRGIRRCRFLCSSWIGLYRFQQVRQPFWIYLTGV